jgi:hypothetical protein
VPPERCITGHLTASAPPFGELAVPLLLLLMRCVYHRPRGGGGAEFTPRCHCQGLRCCSSPPHHRSWSSRYTLCPPRAARELAEGLLAPWAEIAVGRACHCPRWPRRRSANGPHQHCGRGLRVTVPLGHGGFDRLAIELFFYFSNIFKSLQIQNFVLASIEFRKL